MSSEKEIRNMQEEFRKKEIINMQDEFRKRNNKYAR